MRKTALVLAALAGLTLMGCASRGYYDEADYRVGNYHGHAPGDTYYSDQERWQRDHAYRGDDRYRDRYYDRYDDRY